MNNQKMSDAQYQEILGPVLSKTGMLSYSSGDAIELDPSDFRTIIDRAIAQSASQTNIIAATNFSAYKHRNQRRKDLEAAPYVNHPISLAHVLTCEVDGIDDQNVVIAALLHDTIEDTDTTNEEIEAKFGKKVLSIVLEVSDDKSLPKLERKRLQIEHAKHLSHEAKLVKLADRICNVRDLVNNCPVGWTLTRVIEYFEWSKSVVDEMRGTHLELEKLFDEVFLMKPRESVFMSSLGREGDFNVLNIVE